MAAILHVTHRYLPAAGGAEQFVHQIARRQAAAGHEVTVLATDALDFTTFWDPRGRRASPAAEEIEGVRVIRTPIRHLPFSTLTFPLLRRLQVAAGRLPGGPLLAAGLGRLAPYLPELPAVLAGLGRSWDTVFGWSVTFDGLAAAAQATAEASRARFIAAPLLHLGEGPKSPVRRFYTMPHQLELIARADWVLALTEIERDFLLAHGCAADRVVVIGAGVDPDAVLGGDGGAFRQRHRLDGPIVAAIGPLTRDKGTLQLLEAAAILAPDRPDFYLVLAGVVMADFAAGWQKVPAAIKSRCTLVGQISDMDKRDLLAAADIVAQPSRVESFGLVFLEAWLYGKPVVGARAGGVPAVVEDGRDGLLVPFGDAGALAEALARLLVDPELAARLGENGRRKAAGYTWDAVHRRLADALEGPPGN
jgi:glycosyltransferase involved in cell wall biosynthesis